MKVHKKVRFKTLYANNPARPVSATQFHISHLLTLGQCSFSIVSYTRRRPSSRGLPRDYEPSCGPSVEEYGHIILTLPMNIGASCCLQQAWDQDGSGK